MTSQQETPVTTHTVILASPNDWDEWIGIIKRKASANQIWKYVDPSTPADELPKLEEPTRASPQDVNSQKTLLSKLDEDEKEELRMLRLDHRDNLKLYRKQLSALDTLCSQIQSSISRTYLVYTLKSDTTYDVLVSLKQRVAPTDEARKILLATQYGKLKKALRNQNFEVWVQEWEKVYTECVELGLPEVEGNRSVRDFVYAVESTSPSWSEYWKNEFQRLDWKKKTLPSFFEITEIYRNHRRTELAQKGKNPQGSFAATFKGEPSESPTPESKPESSADEKKKEGKSARTCLCGKRHYFNQCWYIAESTRPSGWKPNEEVQKKVEEKIANATPEVKARIEQIKKDDREKPKDGNKKSSQEPNGSFAVHQVGAYNISSDYHLRDSVILDPGSNVHVFNDRARFISDIEPVSEYIYTGTRTEKIVGYGTAAVTIDHPDGKKQIRLSQAAYIPGFHTNLVCLQKLNEKGVYWNNEKNTLYYGDNVTYAYCSYHGGHSTIEYNEPKESSQPVASFATQPPVKHSSKPLQNEAEGRIWHQRLGHAGKNAIKHLLKSVTGAILKGPTTVECESCGVSKAHKVISRRQPTRSLVPFYRIHLDLIPGIVAYNGDQYVAHFLDDATRLNDVEAMAKKSSLPQVVIKYCNVVERRYGFKVAIIHTDGETALGNNFKECMAERGITLEISPPHTQSQNGSAERSGRVIIEKSRCMRIEAHLPEELWPEIKKAAAYLINRTPSRGLRWQTPFQKIQSVMNISPLKPNIGHLRVYGCRAYPLKYNIPRLNKLAPRAHVGYLVGYDSTNIFRVYIPSEKKVIRTRDVQFNEQLLYDDSQPDLANVLRERADQMLDIIDVYQERNLQDELESSSDESDEALDEIHVDTDGRRQVDSGGNQDEPNIESSEQPDSESSKDDSAPGLLTPDETPEPNHGAPPSLPTDIGESPSPLQTQGSLRHRPQSPQAPQ